MINLTLKQQRAHTKYPCASGIAETKKNITGLEKSGLKEKKVGAGG